MKQYGHRSLTAAVLRKIPGPLGAWSQHLHAPLLRAYDDKVRYRCEHDRNPLLPVLTDKLAVRDFVADRVGTECLPTVYAAGRHLDERWFADLPSRYVIKTNHGSGGIILVGDHFAADGRLPAVDAPDTWGLHAIRPEALDFDRARAVTDRWLAQDFGSRPGEPRIWAYGQVPPQVFVEAFLEDETGEVPADVKCYMFDGRCELIAVIQNRFGTRQAAMFNPDLSRADVRLWSKGYLTPDEAFTPPARIAEMVTLAEQLSAGLEHVRVDLYDTVDGVRFGEMTCYPHGGVRGFEPDEANHRIGASWQPDYRPRRR